MGVTPKIYVVSAYRWGLRDCHSYVVGAKMSRDEAVTLADAHVEYRGGKYGCEVVECDGETAKSVYYHECPYFGVAGHGNTAQPVDTNKTGWTYAEEAK